MVSGLGFVVVGTAHSASAAASTATTPPSPAVPSATASTLHDVSTSSAALQALQATKDRHLPIEAVSLPNLMGHASVRNGVVQPLQTVAPAPMGLGTYGVMNTTGTPEAYTLETQSWEGSITLNSVNTFLLTNDGAISTNGSQNTFGVQLNAVTNNSTVGTNAIYSFWTQNVLYFNFPVPGYITFLDNVWNFSSPATLLEPGTLYSYNGTPVYPSYYYDFGPSFPISFPLTVQLYLNSSTTNDVATGFGYTTVRFGYNVIDASTGMSEAAGVYDTVMFNSTTPIGQVPASPYLVDGSQVTPTGFIPWDAEIMIGGPGGGTTTSIYGISGSESLQYWDATSSSYLNVKDAWNVGSETGETSEGIAETWTSAGTVQLNTGPSFVMPFWNATPGGNMGQATLSAPLSPSNAFVFFTPGSSFDPNYASWAPTQTADSVNFIVPPGTYTVNAMMSDYTPIQTTVALTAGQSTTTSFSMTRNMAEGVYAPLFAWNNDQLAAISTGGSGTESDPYLVFNNAAGGGLNSVFGQFNDYLYPVFPGVLIADTTAYANLDHPSTLGLTYQSGYFGALDFYGLPHTNNLMFEIYDASNVSIWDAQGVSGWFFYFDYGPTGFLPLANIVIWGGTHDLVGDSVFYSQGSSLLLAGVDPTAPTGNVVWGNTVFNSLVLSPTMYPGDGATNGPPVALFAFESGDLIYNNAVFSTFAAYAPNANMFFGSYQVNAENWNLSQVEPASYVNMFNGYALTGSILGGDWQGGNYISFTSGYYIATGGDFLPYAAIVFAAYGPYLTPPSGEWSVTVTYGTQSVTEVTSGYFLVFWVPAATYTFTAAVVGGGTITPDSGTITMYGVSTYVPLIMG